MHTSDSELTSSSVNCDVQNGFRVARYISTKCFNINYINNYYLMDIVSNRKKYDEK